VDLISKLKLTNFRGIKQGEADLSPLTVLVGSNNSAKTTLLEAIYLAQGPFHPAPYTIPNPTPIGQSNQGSDVLSVLAYLHKTLNDQFTGGNVLTSQLY
jgi:predicted ATP-dependent endonuclease of OLD family